MKKDRVVKEINRHFKRLRKKGRQLLPGYDADVIHKFRTDYKQLKDFLKMVSTRKKDKKAAIPRKLRDAYHLLGIIRDLQLQVKDTKEEAQRLPGYRKILQIHIARAKQQLIRSFSPKLVTASGKKTFARIRSGFYHKHFRKYLQQNAALVRQMVMTGAFSDKDLHTIRKVLKGLVHVRDLFSNDKEQSNIPGLRFMLNPSQGLMDRLGSLQDQRNSLLLLRRYRSASMSAAEAAFMREKEEKLLTGKESMKAQLEQELKCLLQQTRSVVFNKSRTKPF